MSVPAETTRRGPAAVADPVLGPLVPTLKTPAVGSSLATARIAADRLDERDIAQLTQYNCRDRVAGLLGRCTPTSLPEPPLKDLKAMTPRGLAKLESTSRKYHSGEQRGDADPFETRFLRKRDRMTDFVKVLMTQKYVTRK